MIVTNMPDIIEVEQGIITGDDGQKYKIGVDSNGVFFMLYTE